MKKSRTSLLSVAVALAAGSAVAHASTYVLIDNSNKGLFTGTLGVNNGDSLVLTQANTFWGDLSNFDASSVIATDVDNFRLYRFDASTGGILDTSAVIDRSVLSVAYDAGTGTFYGLGRTGTLELFSIDFNTGITNTIGAVGLSSTDTSVSLCFDPFSGDLLMTEAGGNLFSINAGNGAGALIGNTGVGSPFGIEYNPVDGEIYLSDAGNDSIYRVNRADASLTFFNTLDDATFATGLAFLPTPGAASLLAMAGLLAARRRR